jgi:hypothetical protein
MGEQVWTVDEANEALPRITAAVESAREAARRIAARTARARARSPGNGHVPDDDARATLASVLRSLDAEGIVLRDIERGLIDFPARSSSGRSYWLCWVVGEAAVEWWHWPEDGFAGRTPLTEPPP